MDKGTIIATAGAILFAQGMSTALGTGIDFYTAPIVVAITLTILNWKK